MRRARCSHQVQAERRPRGAATIRVPPRARARGSTAPRASTARGPAGARDGDPEPGFGSHSNVVEEGRRRPRPCFPALRGVSHQETVGGRRRQPSRIQRALGSEARSAAPEPAQVVFFPKSRIERLLGYRAGSLKREQVQISTGLPRRAASVAILLSGALTHSLAPPGL